LSGEAECDLDPGGGLTDCGNGGGGGGRVGSDGEAGRRWAEGERHEARVGDSNSGQSSTPTRSALIGYWAWPIYVFPSFSFFVSVFSFFLFVCFSVFCFLFLSFPFLFSFFLNFF
jgi:hypothetical protein